MQGIGQHVCVLWPLWSFWLLVTERAFLPQKSALLLIDHVQKKNKKKKATSGVWSRSNCWLRLLSDCWLRLLWLRLFSDCCPLVDYDWVLFHYLLVSMPVIIKNRERTRIKLLNEIRNNAQEKICYTKNVL